MQLNFGKCPLCPDDFKTAIMFDGLRWQGICQIHRLRWIPVYHGPAPRGAERMTPAEQRRNVLYLTKLALVEPRGFANEAMIMVAEAPKKPAKCRRMGKGKDAHPARRQHTREAR